VVVIAPVHLSSVGTRGWKLYGGRPAKLTAPNDQRLLKGDWRAAKPVVGPQQ
jgi:hypothetical protein